MSKEPIKHAAVWAAVMIAVSLMIGDHEKSKAILLLMIGGWIATGGLSAVNYKSECAAYRRMLGINNSETPEPK